jgi:hypothetical protein
MTTARIDPDLSRALANATSSDEVVLNVFLKIAFPSDVKSADQRAEQAAALIRRVDKSEPTTTKFQFRALDNVLQVKARMGLVRRLIREPEVIAATSAPSHESAMIQPIERREVSRSRVDRPFQDSGPQRSRRPR